MVQWVLMMFVSFEKTQWGRLSKIYTLKMLVMYLSEMKWALCNYFRADAQLNQVWPEESVRAKAPVILSPFITQNLCLYPPLSGMTPFLTVWVRRRTVRPVVDHCWMIRPLPKTTSILHVSSHPIITSAGWWAGECWKQRWRNIEERFCHLLPSSLSFIMWCWSCVRKLVIYNIFTSMFSIWFSVI